MKRALGKRIICLLLTLAMLAALVPAVFAARDEEERKITPPTGKFVVSQSLLELHQANLASPTLAADRLPDSVL